MERKGDFPRLSLVLGGTNSGKSEFAEQVAADAGRRPVYLATALAGDDEMESKIALHKSRRGPEWRLVEEPLDVGQAIAECGADEVVLLECATNWLLNVTLKRTDSEAELEILAEHLESAPCPVVIVSNEIGLGVIPESSFTRNFMAAQGRLNRLLSSMADIVVLVVAGVPLELKGRVPK